jgi:hypothetical protein
LPCLEATGNFQNSRSVLQHTIGASTAMMTIMRSQMTTAIACSNHFQFGGASNARQIRAVELQTKAAATDDKMGDCQIHVIHVLMDGPCVNRPLLTLTVNRWGRDATIYRSGLLF